MATKENLVATEENTSDSTSERVDESEEVSVGSPEEPQGEDDGDCSPPPPPPRHPPPPEDYMNRTCEACDRTLPRSD